MKLKIVGLDPSLTNTGIAICEFDTDTDDYTVTELRLVETENESGKQVRRNSDDVRRAKQISESVHEACNGAVFAVSEVPTGAQSARAALAFGMVIGILANLPVPLIEVSPTEVKMAAVGHRQAAKEEMIEWAVTKFPTAKWLTKTQKGKTTLVAKNEHLADAVAVVQAGILTNQFRQAIAVLGAVRQAA